MSKLSTNTTDLQAILDKVNALPQQESVELQEKTVTPATSSQTVTPDSGYDGLARVTVNAIPPNYEDVAEETEAYTDSLGELESVINSLPDAGDTTITLQEKTATPSTAAQNILPDSGYDGLSKVTVAAMPTATQATPSITVSSAGLITASATQTAGYVAAGTKSATKQLTTQAAQTITPGTTDQTIASGKYLTGTQTIKGDANLVSANIAEGVSIFGVTGTHAGGSGDSGGGGELEECFFATQFDTSICIAFEDVYNGPTVLDGYSWTNCYMGFVRPNSIVTLFSDDALSFSCTDAELVYQVSFSTTLGAGESDVHTYYVYMFRITGAEANIEGTL